MLRRGPPTNVLGVVTALATVRYAAAVDLPYNPTRIFRDETSKYAYVIQPSAGTESNDGQAQLLSLDISDSLEASSLSHTTLFASLPFLDSESQRAIVPVMDSSGNITVVSGNCSNTDTLAVWTFAPGTKGKNGNGTWTQRMLSPQEVAGGAKYLSSAISFSVEVDYKSSDLDLFTFGGMCPFTNSTSTTWTTRANYTNQMIEYTPKQGVAGNISYTSNRVASRGPPVAEAGFSITPLTPAYSANSSDGTQTQQQNFVLLGGHTGAAFINMSSVALFSLPEQSWTFLPVNQPSGSSSKRELASRATSTVVEPRSGHTAVLSEDGNSIIVFGGWVGDVTTPADPQLAVLALGSGYGGVGDWTWSAPAVGSSNMSGAGLYGHGALMLPGGVMMVAGGYSIATSSSKSRLFRRASTTTSSTQTLFYNVSSQSWISTYVPPASVTSTSAAADTERKGALTTTSQKAGLGVGLTIGILLVVGLLFYYFWHARRLRKRREARASDKEGLMRRTDTFGNSWFGGAGIDGRGGAVAAGGTWTEKLQPVSGDYTWLPQDVVTEQPVMQARNEVERSGLMVNIPSPTRGLRKGAPSRAQYQYHAAPRYDDGRMSRSSGNIHPIEERDEEEDRLSAVNGERPMSPGEHSVRAVGTFAEGERSGADPFKDPPPNPLRSHPVSPEVGPPVGSAVRRSATNATNTSAITNGTDQVSGWIREWTASYAAAMRPTSDNPHSSGSSSGRNSPTKTERTSSNLSEQSIRSGLSASARSVARTSSTRSGLFFGLSGTPSIIPGYSNYAVEERFLSAPTTGRSRSPHHAQYRPESEVSYTQHLAVRPSAHRTATAETFATGSTTWGQLIEQSEALLGNGPVNPHSSFTATPSSRLTHDTIAPLHYPKRRVSEKAKDQDQTSTATLLANAGPAPPIPPRRRLGWMGSLRRALGTHDRSFSSAQPLNPHHPQQYIPNTLTQLQQYHDMRSANSSPTKSIRTNGVTSRQSRNGASSSMSNGPRRAASDSSEFLRLKRGRRDWERAEGEPEDPRWVPYRDEPSPDLGGDWGEIPEILIEPLASPTQLTHNNKRNSSSLAKRDQQHHHQQQQQQQQHHHQQQQQQQQQQPPRENAYVQLVDPGSPDPEQDDWDVERAAAARDVQVMFTVPKARLRVVNADPDRASQRSISEGGVSTRSAHNTPTAPQDEFPPLQPDPHADASAELDEPRAPFSETEAGRARALSEGLRQKSETESLESFQTARAPAADAEDGERGSHETVRKGSSYGVEIMEWEREALEQRDAEEDDREKRHKGVIARSRRKVSGGGGAGSSVGDRVKRWEGKD